MPANVLPLIIAVVAFGLVICAIMILSDRQSLNGIKSRTVGDGQHGTARWATTKEIHSTFQRVPFHPALWRKNPKARPGAQGVILGSESKRIIKRGTDLKKKRWEVTALVDSDDIHVLMIGASGIGKTAFFLYPNLEYACASGMSFLALDTKGDLARNYGAVAMEHYGYHVAVVDLRNPTRSDGYNLLTLINHYMDVAREQPENLAARA